MNNYRVITRHLSADMVEFETRRRTGETVSTVQMTRTKAVSLGLIPA